MTAQRGEAAVVETAMVGTATVETTKMVEKVEKAWH
jgi:hypothetical protein